MARDEGDSGRGEHRGLEHKETMMAGAGGSQLISRSTLTAAGLIGVAALIEPELLVGMAIGAGIAMASNWLPDLVSGTVGPIFKTAIKAGYSAASMAREMFSEASENLQDIVAEARAERGRAQ